MTRAGTGLKPLASGSYHRSDVSKNLAAGVACTPLGAYISRIMHMPLHSVRGLWYRPVYRTQPDHELARHVRDAGAKLFHRRYRVIDRSRSDPWCISSTLLCARRTNVSSDLSDHADLFHHHSRCRGADCRRLSCDFGCTRAVSTEGRSSASGVPRAAACFGPPQRGACALVTVVLS